jgi:putative transposase
MNRGARKQRIFADDEDRKTFLKLVEECNTRFGMQTHAFVLIPNHYHLLVFDESGRLSRAMRHLDGVHTQAFNRRHSLDGPLFRGRFKSRLVGGEEYLLEVFRYVHYNPVKHGLAKRAGDYLWSSHRHYLDAKAPPWLVVDEFLERFGGPSAESLRELDRFVHERGDQFIKGVEVEKRWSPLLGDEAFLSHWREWLQRNPAGADREVPGGRQLADTTADDVIAATCEVMDVTPGDIRGGKRGNPNLARQIAMAVSAWDTQASRKRIAEAFSIAPASVSVLGKRYQDALDADPEGSRLREAVRAKLRGE